MSKPTKQELEEMTRYEIFRTGNNKQRHYQINKLVMGVKVEDYWVHLLGRDRFTCSCPGFGIQKYPLIEHKHIKLAMDYWDRGEPEGAQYMIHGSGANSSIEYLGQKLKEGDTVYA